MNTSGLDLSMEQIFCEQLINLKVINLVYQSSKGDLVANLGQLRQRAAEEIEDNLSRAVINFIQLYGPSNTHRMSAYAQVSTALTEDVERIIFSKEKVDLAARKQDEAAKDREANRIQDNLTKEVTVQKETIAILSTEKQALELAQDSLSKANLALKRELEASTCVSDEASQLCVELRMQGLDFKAEVDRRCERILAAVQSRLGFIPPTVQRYVMHLSILKPPGDPSYDSVKARKFYSQVHHQRQARAGGDAVTGTARTIAITTSTATATLSSDVISEQNKIRLKESDSVNNENDRRAIGGRSFTGGGIGSFSSAAAAEKLPQPTSLTATEAQAASADFSAALLSADVKHSMWDTTALHGEGGSLRDQLTFLDALEHPYKSTTAENNGKDVTFSARKVRQSLRDSRSYRHSDDFDDHLNPEEAVSRSILSGKSQIYPINRHDPDKKSPPVNVFSASLSHLNWSPRLSKYTNLTTNSFSSAKPKAASKSKKPIAVPASTTNMFALGERARAKYARENTRYARKIAEKTASLANRSAYTSRVNMNGGGRIARGKRRTTYAADMATPTAPTSAPTMSTIKRNSFFTTEPKSNSRQNKKVSLNIGWNPNQSIVSPRASASVSRPRLSVSVLSTPYSSASLTSPGSPPTVEALQKEYQRLEKRRGTGRLARGAYVGKAFTSQPQAHRQSDEPPYVPPPSIVSHRALSSQSSRREDPAAVAVAVAAGSHTLLRRHSQVKRDGDEEEELFDFDSLLSRGLTNGGTAQPMTDKMVVGRANMPTVDSSSNYRTKTATVSLKDEAALSRLPFDAEQTYREFENSRRKLSRELVSRSYVYSDDEGDHDCLSD